MTVPPPVVTRRPLRARLALVTGLIVLGGAAPAVADPAPPGGPPSSVVVGAATASVTETAATSRATGSRAPVRVPRARAARATVSGRRVVLRWTRPRGARATLIETKDRTTGQKAWRRSGQPVRGTRKTLTLRAGHAYRIRLVHRSAVRGGRNGRPGPSILVRVPRATAPAAPQPLPVAPAVPLPIPTAVADLRIATSGDTASAWTGTRCRARRGTAWNVSTR